ncbi:MAG: hypothetical protein L0Y67_06700 [Gammaproteobacteria bacterium]|nr:hypothetical protein [Gammaproteobacteria bacterium]MCI0591274.1 hypothetical protein [Gammaproteobacteria bacterium]
MSYSEAFMIVPNPVLSGLIWFIVLALLLYIARAPAHRVILSFSRILHHAMRLSANSVIRAEQKLSQRNKEVLLAAGREASERILEREFERVYATIRRDLGEFPSLHRKLSEEFTLMEEDYKQSTEVPPSPLAWTKAVEAVAKIPAKGDPTVSDILAEIHRSMVKAHDRALEEYRKATHVRHTLLSKMTPYWRRLQRALGLVDKNINSLLERAKIIDRHIEDYENIQNQTDRALRMLSSSALTQFFISSIVLVIAIGGAMINFHLIARPMAEMVGGHNTIGNFRIADISALVIILVEISMGLFLMESLRITRLFPVVGALKDQIRNRMVWTTFIILFILASVEAGLAFLREILMQDELATSALLRGDDVGEFKAEFVWITTAAQMGLGFILPFALVFVAIPLETFVHSLRTVLGMIGIGFLRGVAFVLRLIGNVFRYFGNMLVHIYDLSIFVPLWIEKHIRTRVMRTKAIVADADPKTETLTIGGAS